jgi:hypothetical protein
LDTILFFVGFVAESVVVALLLRRRAYRTLPLFFTYLVWSVVSDAGLFYMAHRFPNSDLNIYLAQAVVDSIFMFGVLIELSMSVLRPVRASLPRGAMVAVAFGILFVGTLIWPFAESPGSEQLLFVTRMVMHLQLTFHGLKVLFFIAVAMCSQLLAIGWRDRELQIATGFGFYSLAGLSASLFHRSQAVGNPTLGQQYHVVDLMVTATYICSMIYWCVCFLQEVPERREFSPQMQNFLLAVAGSARSSRIALTNSAEPKRKEAGKR